MSERLKDKVVIVTGSSMGIGKGIALAFAKEGAIVVTNSRKLERAEVTANEIRNMGQQALAVEADLAKTPDIDNLIDTTIENFGRIDILVNNAGIILIGPSEDFSEQDWDRSMATDLKAPFLCSQKAAKRAMIPQKSGIIINISSGYSKRPKEMRTAYCVAKAGVNMLTQILGHEWAKYNIRVVAIAPGFIMTEMVRQSIAQGTLDTEFIVSRTPMRRLGEVEEIADTAVFLASDDASFITGEVIFVEGGITSGMT